MSSPLRLLLVLSLVLPGVEAAKPAWVERERQETAFEMASRAWEFEHNQRQAQQLEQLCRRLAPPEIARQIEAERQHTLTALAQHYPDIDARIARLRARTPPAVNERLSQRSQAMADSQREFLQRLEQERDFSKQQCQELADTWKSERLEGRMLLRIDRELLNKLYRFDPEQLQAASVPPAPSRRIRSSP
ncbi:hypothetical protein [Chitinimonas lacunae]|uniref:DUF3106 domain-containing protein n=1 Tax=Chitinimonas lacunae TaxID=1963018 RepID=A0ABV8MX09_9NEIS